MSQTGADRRARAHPHVGVALTALAAAALTGAAFWWTFRWMGVRWLQENSYYSHGWLVPPIGAGLLWLRRREFAAAPVRPSGWGLLVLIPSLAVHVLATSWQVGVFSGLALMGVVSGLVLTLLGPRILRLCWFPIAFLAFMVPLPEALIENVSFKMKLMAAGTATGALELLGLAAVREGSYIRIPAGTVIVDDVCSGLKYLIALTAFGAVYAHISRLGPRLKLVLFAASIPIAFVANVGRVTLMVLAAHFSGIESTEKWYFHDFFGFALFATAFIFLFGTEYGLLRASGAAGPAAKTEPGADTPEAAAPGAAEAASQNVCPRLASARPAGRLAAVTLGVLALAAAASIYVSWPRGVSPATDVWAAIPTRIGSWQGTDHPLSEREYEILGTRDVLSRSYVNPGADRVLLVVVVAQQMRKRSHPPEQCLTGEGYLLRAVNERTLSLPAGTAGDSLRVRELVLDRGQESRITWYFFKSGPHLNSSYWRHQARVALRKVTDPDAADVLVRIETSVAQGKLEGGRAVLRGFFADAGEALLTRLP